MRAVVSGARDFRVRECRVLFRYLLFLGVILGVSLQAQEVEESDPVSAKSRPADIGENAKLSQDELEDFEALSSEKQAMLKRALELTTRNLTYTYGSADPDAGGMDCSGTIYYILRENGYKDAPRTASAQYAWVRKQGNFRAVLSADPDSFELEALEPGDLLFWSGTYKIDRDPPVTHSMIYLGKEKKDGREVMFGASNGRSYRGTKRWGVGVFDFKAGSANPDPGETGARFVGYGKLTTPESEAKVEKESSEEATASAVKPLEE